MSGGVVFEVGAQLWFLPATIALKLIPSPKVARVPGGPPELRGVALVDGEMIPVVDVRSAAERDAALRGVDAHEPMLVCSLAPLGTHGETIGLVGQTVLATGFFEAVPRHGDRTAKLFDVAGAIAQVREGRWAV